MPLKEFLKPKRNMSGVLRFTPYAYAKIIYMRDSGETEIGGYGITETDDPLLVTDFKLVKQECTSISVDLDTDDSLRFIEDMVDRGLAPWQCQNIWIHTHPGNSPTPSGADEENFIDNFSLPNCAIFYILAKEGKDYTRMRFNVAPGIDVDISSKVDYSIPFEGSNEDEWKKEYEDKVMKKAFVSTFSKDDKKSITEFLRESHMDYKGRSRFDNFSEDVNERFDLDNLDNHQLEEGVDYTEDEETIEFYVEEEKDYYKFDKKLRRFYDENGKRIKHPKQEWMELIHSILSNQNDHFEDFRGTGDDYYDAAIARQIN